MPSKRKAAPDAPDAIEEERREGSGSEEHVYQPDETIPGGLYYAADGVTLTNCWGQRIDQSGKVLD